MVRIQERLRGVAGELSLVELYQHPTIRLLARHLSAESEEAPALAQAGQQGEKRLKGRTRLGSQLARRRRSPGKRRQ